MLQHRLQRCMREMWPRHLGTTNSTGQDSTEDRGLHLLGLGEQRCRCTWWAASYITKEHMDWT